MQIIQPGVGKMDSNPIKWKLTWLICMLIKHSNKHDNNGAAADYRMNYIPTYCSSKSILIIIICKNHTGFLLPSPFGIGVVIFLVPAQSTEPCKLELAFSHAKLLSSLERVLSPRPFSHKKASGSPNFLLLRHFLFISHLCRFETASVCVSVNRNVWFSPFFPPLFFLISSNKPLLVSIPVQ